MLSSSSQTDSAGAIGRVTRSPSSSTATKCRNTTTTTTCYPAELRAALPCSAVNIVTTAGSRDNEGNIPESTATTAAPTDRETHQLRRKGLSDSKHQFSRESASKGSAVSVADDGSGLLVLDHTKPQPHLPDRSLHRVRLSSVAASQGRRSSTRLTVTGIPARSGTPSQPNPPLHPVQSLDRSWTPGVHLRRLTSQLTNS